MGGATANQAIKLINNGEFKKIKGGEDVLIIVDLLLVQKQNGL